MCANFNCGYGIGVTSPMIVQLIDNFLGEGKTSWFASSIVIGQIFGSLLGSFFANRLGRKKSCIIAALLSCVGWSVIAASQKYWMLVLGRIIAGFFDCLAIPGGYMYISEVTEQRLKGSFLNATAIFSGLGIAFGYLFGSHLLWRFACLIPITTNIAGIVLFIFCYESPVYLLMKNQSARDCLNWYRQHNIQTKNEDQLVERELKEIESEVSSFGKGMKETARKLVRGDNLKAFLTLGVLFSLFPLSGVYNITFFAVDLFNKLGLGGAETVAVFCAMVRVLGTFSSTLLLLRFGRKVIYVTCSVLVTIIMGSLGSIEIIRNSGYIDDTLVSWILTVLIMLFMFMVGVAIGFPWILMGEWFTPDLKAVVNTSLITYSFLMIFLAVQTSNLLIGILGTGGLFLYFCSICGLMTIFVTIFVPETHGRLYEQRRKLETFLNAEL